MDQRGLKVSLIVNTACGDPVLARTIGRYQNQPYGARVRLLRNYILPSAIRDGFDEIILAGILPDGLLDAFPTVKGVSSTLPRRDKWDPLTHRDDGARASGGDVLVFCHDDHMPPYGLVEALRSIPADVDVMAHPRIHGQSGVQLNNGRAQGYVGGHYCCVRRSVWERRPWTSLTPRDTDDAWDVDITRAWCSIGARIVWVDTLPFTDLDVE